MKTGRNDPCPCGSGLKYKRCCLAHEEAPQTYTQEDRAWAFTKLARFTERLPEDEHELAQDEFDEDAPALPDEFDAFWHQTSRAVFDMWIWFDRRLADGRRIVDVLLADDPTLTQGERLFLDLARGSSMRLYEIEEAVPGVSLALRDVTDGARITVREKSGSRQLRRADLVAARVITRGASGEPELESGLLPVPPLLHARARHELAAMRTDWLASGGAEAGFWKDTPPFFHALWANALVNPSIPRLANKDGDELLTTRATFAVRDESRLVAALDRCSELERHRPGAAGWTWSGPAKSGESVVLGQLRLEGARLTLETNSAARGDRGRSLVERLAGDAIAHRATTHEDPAHDLREALKGGFRDAAPARREAPEDAVLAGQLDDAALEFVAQHYRRWVDEPVPALDGRTPREAAREPARREAVAELVRGIEGLYEEALRRNAPAYDPSWMWAELGLADESARAHPPPLAHERWAEAFPGWEDASRSVVEPARERPGFDVRRTVLELGALDSSLAYRRLVKTWREQPADGRGADAPGVDDASSLARGFLCSANHDLHRRKTFWVDESLAFMLAHTDFDVTGDELRLPFPSFAFVFADRHTLSLAERLLAGERTSPLAGHLLRVLTVYVSEVPEDRDRALRFSFAMDALGADPPHLVEHTLRLRPDAKVELPDATPAALADGGRLPNRRPLPSLLHVVVNAILYATSAGVEPQVRTAPSASPHRRADASKASGFVSSEEVYFLPGSITISRARQLQELDRIPSGREVLHRFLVRGHWRRAAPAWKDQRLRWIEPYWKGPDLAAIVERTYRLAP